MGGSGVGARITPHGLQLLALADELARAREAVLARFAGTPALAGGLGLLTSMRNQLLCEVLACEPFSRDDPMMLIRLRTAGGAELNSSVTRESADLLALRPGATALLLCKATAVLVQAGASLLPSARDVNRLAGRIDCIARGEGRDEGVIGHDGGGLWVGFAALPFATRRGQRAWAVMATSALVVGLV